MELREMLELAALAGGLSDLYQWDEESECIKYPYKSELTNSHLWNPLTDDGDSRRLEVALKLSVCVCDEAVIVEQCMGSFQALEKLGLDPLAATRMAVLRCAAEVGKSIRAEGDAA